MKLLPLAKTVAGIISSYAKPSFNTVVSLILLLFFSLSASENIAAYVSMKIAQKDAEILASQEIISLENTAILAAFQTKPPDKPKQNPLASPSPIPISPKPQHQSQTLFDQLFEKYASEYGVNPETLKRIARCESGFNPHAANGPYCGMFQFHASTWTSNRKAMGLDPDLSLRFNAEEAIKTAAFKISRDGTGAWPVCSQ